MSHQALLGPSAHLPACSLAAPWTRMPSGATDASAARLLERLAQAVHFVLAGREFSPDLSMPQDVPAQLDTRDDVGPILNRFLKLAAPITPRAEAEFCSELRRIH